MANFGKSDDLDGMKILAAVERESSRSSRNRGSLKFSPKLDRPSNPLGKLLDKDFDDELMKYSDNITEEPSSLVSTLASTKD